MEEKLALAGLEAAHGLDIALWHFNNAMSTGDDIYHTFGGAGLVDLFVIDTREEIAGEHGLFRQGVLFETFVLACQQR